MALIICPECNAEISDKAANCPKCGYPISSENSSLKIGIQNPDSPLSDSQVSHDNGKKNSKLIIIAAILIVAMVLGLLFYTGGLNKIISSFGPKETVELTKDNFLDYFDVTISVGNTVQDSAKRDILGYIGIC